MCAHLGTPAQCVFVCSRQQEQPEGGKIPISQRLGKVRRDDRMVAVSSEKGGADRSNRKGGGGGSSGSSGKLSVTVNLS